MKNERAKLTWMDRMNRIKERQREKGKRQRRGGNHF
jgi:hypothetical protein